MTAAPGGGEYGPLTVTVAYWADAETLFTLPRGAFWPVPEVRSALVRVARRPGVVADAGYRTFSAMVSRLFGQRRKTLGHTLRAGWGAERARAALERVGVGEATRVEELGVEQLRAMAEELGRPT